MGFQWVVGDGRSTVATKDLWLAQKFDFRVDNLKMYEGREEKVATLFYPNSKTWDPERVHSVFIYGDATAILATNVPQRQVEDRIVWAKSLDRIYSVKTGYYFWQNLYAADSNCAQSEGWKRIWRLSIPHKVKISVWRFCRNNVLVFSAPEWLLQKLSSARYDEVVAICLVLWGIWFWRNKRV
ncbi:uncharacterized protein LOC141691531 [Apium graveolens]|uniref:uncharacterized protein LOC141691531 n=1 Tax=Apium graveolens TaxID=4045 RepID=UPI003D7B96D0